MNWWARIKAWFAQPDPFDEQLLTPDGTQPIPSDLFVPGESQAHLIKGSDKWKRTPEKH